MQPELLQSVDGTKHTIKWSTNLVTRLKNLPNIFIHNESMGELDRVILFKFVIIPSPSIHSQNRMAENENRHEGHDPS